jgi:calcium-dependent protein kinase
LKKPINRKKNYQQDAECAYLVMERLRGGDLDQALASSGPLSERAAAAVAHEVLKVVATCHAAGVMHGDVKPANFMLREASSGLSSTDGEHGPVLASTAVIESLVEGGSRPPARWLSAVDFGCAQPLGRASLNRRTGTPVYMAPEVFQRDYGREADLWSAGVMLYQLLSGRFPFWRSLDDCRSRSVDEVMRSVLGDPVPLSGGVWEGKSPACVDLLAGLLDRDPGARLTAADALEHPWFREQLGGSLSSSSSSAAGSAAAAAALAAESNIVPMAGSHHHDGHYRPAAACASPSVSMRPHAFSSPPVAPACAWYAPGPSGVAVA